MELSIIGGCILGQTGRRCLIFWEGSLDQFTREGDTAHTVYCRHVLCLALYYYIQTCLRVYNSTAFETLSDFIWIFVKQ
jgi:hypothetical protein